MIAAQLYETAKVEIPDLSAKVSSGQFKELREWLRVKVHEVGSLYASPDELVTSITGKPLDPNIYTSYLEHKYEQIYGL
jgi:carboxypeptidase Taq